MEDAGGPFPSSLEVVRLAQGPPRRTLATAESCTGGLLGAALTSVPGSSAVYLGGVVAYSNQVKFAELGVRPSLLKRWGTVSLQVATAMAAAVRLRLDADYGVGITGVAGPAASEAKPAGLIFVAVVGPRSRTARRLDGDLGRAGNRDRAVQEALSMLARELGT